MKKILLYFSCFAFCLISLSFATTKDNSSNQNLDIVIPQENIKTIPIIGYKFVYMEVNLSLLDFGDSYFKKIDKALSLSGVMPTNHIIIFLDHTGYNSNTNKPNIFNEDNPNPDNINFKKYKTDEGIVLNLSNLVTKYSIPFLTYKRTALIGSLIIDTRTPNLNKNFNIIPFNMLDAQGLQLLPLPEKYDYSENNDKNKKDIDVNTIYNKENLINQRIGMIQYMNLAPFKKISYIGMMEMFDKKIPVYNYIVLKGDLNNFLKGMYTNQKVSAIEK